MHAWTLDDREVRFTGRMFNTPLLTQLAFSPDSTLLAASIGDSGLVVWNLARGVKVFSVSPPDSVTHLNPKSVAVAFDRDNDRVLLLTRTALEVWSVSRNLRERGVPTPGVRALVPTTGARTRSWWAAWISDPEGGRLAGPARLGFVDLNAREPTPTRPFELPENADWFVSALSADGNTFALVTTQGVQLWDVADKEMPRRGQLIAVQPATDSSIVDLSFSPSDQHVVVSEASTMRFSGSGVPTSGGGAVSVHAVTDGAQTGRREFTRRPRRTSFSPDGRTLAVVLAPCPIAMAVALCRD